ncbi:MAG TPA: DUF2279 domain-containing protein, partial [Candidatus Kapabacteria bacterium]
TGSLTAAIIALHLYQNSAWWANERSKFHVIEDPSYQADFDKFGHTFGAYYSSYFFDQAYNWAGLDSMQSALFGALSGALFEYYVELEDGFASGWGFSRGDAKSDILGSSFYLLNQRVPFLRNFRYKWFYTPTNKLTKDQPDIPGQTVNAIEDYGGQTYYLSANIHNMLPTDWQAYWPKWLNIALGVSGYNINTIDTLPGHAYDDERQKAWYIALDYDVDRMIPPSSSGIVNFILHAFGYWHFPAPAWRFYPNPKFFWLFPISISFDHGFSVGADPSLGGTN